MELGQRIKEARLAAGLSQKALCGDTITRNMLSLIESGKAKPSMETLKVLAERLGKNISYFLEEDGVLSPNQGILATAKTAFTEKQYKVCLSVLDGYQPDGIFDDEKALLEDLSLLELARIALAEKRYIYAKELLRRITFQGLYLARERKNRQAELLVQAGESTPLPSLDEGLLLRAKAALATGDYQKAVTYLSAMEEQDDLWRFLYGQALTALGQFRDALPYLQSAESAFPRETIPLLEQCYLELEDFKNAYAYARKARDH